MVPRAPRRSNNRRAFQIPLHLILVVPFVLQLVGTAGVIGYLSFQNSQRSVESLANQLMEKEGNRIEQKLTAYLEIPHLVNRLNADEAQRGQIDAQNLSALETHLYHQLRQFEAIDTIMFAGAEGSFRSATRDGNRKDEIKMGIADFSQRDEVITYYTDREGNKTRIDTQLSNIDVRRDRPWYQQAVGTGKPGWSPTFQLAFFDILAISAYYPVYHSESNSLIGVFAVNASLNQISQFLKTLTQKDPQEIFIVESNGSLIASSADPTPFIIDRSTPKPQFQRITPLESESALIRTTYRSIQTQVGDLAEIQSNKNLRVTQGKASYSVHIRPFQDQYGLDWRVVTIVPNAVFMNNIHANTRDTILLSTIAAIISAVLGFLLTQYISRPLRRLSKTSKSIAAGELETLVEHSSIVEVEEMTQSLQQMIVQLKASLEAVENSNRHLSNQLNAFFQSAPTGMAIVDRQLRFVQINQQLADIDGYPIEMYLGRTVRELLPELAPVIEPLYLKVLETGQPILSREVSGELPGQPGVMRYWLISYFPLFAAEDTEDSLNRRPSQVGVVVTEISDRKQAEMALSESEAKFSTIFYASPDPAWISTFEEGRCLNVNESLSEFLGYSCEEMLGCTCVELGLWDNLDDLHSFRETLRREGSLQGQEVVWRDRLGQAKTVLISARIHQLYGQVCIIGVAKNITARKQVEAALAQSEAQNRAILQAIPDLMVRIDRDGFYQGYIRNSEMIDLIPEECNPIGRHISEFLSPEQVTRQIASIQQALETGEVQIYEQQQLIQNQIQHEEVRVVVYEDNEALFMIRNITDRKQLELALQHSEARLNDILNRALAAIISYRIYGDREYLLANHFSEQGARDDNWHYEFCSAGCHKVFGYTAEEFTAEANFWYSHVHPEDWRNVLMPRYSRLLTDYISTDEYRFLHQDGTWHWISETATSRWEADSQSWVVILISYDVSDRKRVELELQQAKEAAEAANLAKSIFLANMSHELRTPLNAILGFTELLSNDPIFNIEQKESLGIIHNSGEHLLNLINDILDLSKIEAGHVNLNATNVNLLVLLQSLRDMFASPAADKELRMLLEIADNVPQFILIDAQKLRQVLINLLGNAVKFTQHGQVILRVIVVDDPEASEKLMAEAIPPNSQAATLLNHPFDHQLKNQPSHQQEPICHVADSLQSDSMNLVHLCFEVEDTGIGIALEEQEKIFDAFAQAQSERHSTEGTGLGLAISRKFVRLMGGELKVDSFPGEGSTFSFQLATQIATQPSELVESVQHAVIGLAADQLDYRILVVDDRSVNRQLLKTLLTRIGLQVQEATNGETALQIWHAWRPHLIWMDLRMPGMNGYEATQYIRQTEQQEGVHDSRSNWVESPHPFPRTTIIALTAQVFTDAHDQALAVGCDDVVTKPIQEHIILKKMADHLGIQYQYAESAIASRAQPYASVKHTSNIRSKLSPDDLQVMPAQWITQLHKAALTCYTQDIDALIEQIPPENSTLITELKRLNYEYEYETLIRLSQSQSSD